MTEHRFENISARWRSLIRRDLVTDVARTYLGFGCVALVTVCMSLNTDWDRFSCTGRLMTRDAALGWKAFPRVVRRVIEFHVESLDKLRREFMYRRRHRVHVSMTYGAHGLLIGICELTDVAADA